MISLRFLNFGLLFLLDSLIYPINAEYFNNIKYFLHLTILPIPIQQETVKIEDEKSCLSMKILKTTYQ
jgi:hypothetical protein